MFSDRLESADDALEIADNFEHVLFVPVKSLRVRNQGLRVRLEDLSKAFGLYFEPVHEGCVGHDGRDDEGGDLQDRPEADRGLPVHDVISAAIVSQETI